MPPKNESPKEAPAAPECPECAKKDLEIERLKKLANEFGLGMQKNAEKLQIIALTAKDPIVIRQ